MKILIAYYSKTGSTEKVAEVLKQEFEKNKHKVELVKIVPVHELKAYQYKKNGKNLALKTPVTNIKKFDLILIGTPVWNFCPTPITLAYLRNLLNAKDKNFALFATCTALPGTTIQRMGSILSTKGGKITASITIRSIFSLDEKKLETAKEFAKQLSLNS